MTAPSRCAQRKAWPTPLVLLVGMGFGLLPAPGTSRLAHGQAAPAPGATDEPEGAPIPPSAPAVTPPRVLTAEEPVYPASELASGAHPSVVFQVVIDAEGSVRSAELEHSAGEPFDLAAADALARWRFEPATRGGQPIASRVRIAVHFTLPQFDVPLVDPHAHGVVPDESAPDDTTAPAPEVASDATNPAGEEPPAPETEAASEDSAAPLEARARARAPELRQQARAVSDFQLDRRALDLAPHRDAGHLLEAAPGLVVTRPEGDAVAHRILLRGFDAEHGQDIELTVEGLPLNQPSHLHGQGYADLGFIVPEVVRSIRVTEGVYDPSQGDFAVAGSADFDLGIADRGTTFLSQMGSFRTFREVLILAPEAEADDTFAAVQVRRTQGYGTQRAGLSASALAQFGFAAGVWRMRVLGALAGARSDLAGVVRRDDLAEVGYYGTYDQASARAQNAFSARALAAFLGERRGSGGASTDFAVHLGFTDFRTQSNFTGYTEVSRHDPSWRGRGDLIEQRNRVTSLGLRFRHRGERFHPWSWLEGSLEVGTSMRIDQTEQGQSLLAAPENETWDTRIDATVLGADLGLWVDADLDLGSLVSLRGGVRADALFFDVDDRLGNFIPAYRREDYILGYRRTAFGVAAGPRVSLELHPRRGPSYTVAYGQGYRSPQAITLVDGERAPFTKVHSADAGAHWTRATDDVTLDLRGSAFFTQLSDDVIFEPSENRFERIGASRRLGAVLAADVSLFHVLHGRFSVTGVRATLLDPPPATAEDPAPPFAPGQLVPYVPPVVIRAELGAEHGLGSIRGAAVRGALGVGGSYIGARPLPYAARSPAFALLDAHASVTWRSIELGVSGQNLVGTRYAAAEYLYVSNWDPAAPASRVPERTIAAGTPRTLLFTIGIHP